MRNPSLCVAKAFAIRHAAIDPARRAARYGALGLIALALVACSSITPTRMVPDAAAAFDRKIALRLRVGPVTGAREAFFGGAPFPSNDQVKQALVATLEKAGLSAAAPSATGDAELTLTILSQDQYGMIPTTARMVANYKVVARDGATLWSETYDTTASAGDLGGATRTVRANEGAVRENLQAFIQGIKERWRTQ